MGRKDRERDVGPGPLDIAYFIIAIVALIWALTK